MPLLNTLVNKKRICIRNVRKNLKVSLFQLDGYLFNASYICVSKITLDAGKVHQFIPCRQEIRFYSFKAEDVLGAFTGQISHVKTVALLVGLVTLRPR